MSTLTFDRRGRSLLSIDATGVTITDLASRATRHIAIAGATSAIGFDDQIWVATAELARFGLARFDLAGGPIGAPIALPYAERGALVAAPCGGPAAVWTAAPPVAILEEATGGLALAPHATAQAVLPITGRRGVAISGSQLTMPSGLVLDLPVGSAVTAGVALADGKLLALVIAGNGKRQLAVVSITSAQVNHRQALATADVRFAPVRGYAAVKIAPRAVRVVDLRTGQEVACVALDRDLADHAIDPEGRWLGLRHVDGTVELRDVAKPTAAKVAPAPTASPVIALRRFAVTARGRYARGTFTLPARAADELAIRAPGTGEILGVFPCGADDVDVSVESARGAAPTWSAIGLAARLGVLARIGDQLAARADDLAGVMQRELGRSAAECARELAGLAPRTADLFAVATEQLAELADGDTRTRPRAHGVAAVITPVMLPIGTAHLHVMAALLAGNAVVWKPSPLAAASAQLYAEALHAAGLPPGAFNLVHGGAEVGAALAAHAGIDAVVFTGSRDTARRLRRATCDRLDLATALHLGSKNAAIVTAGADLAAATTAIAEAAFLTAGQRATAIGRVLVDRAVVEPFLAALAPKVAAVAASPMFSAERLARFTARIAAAEAAGARPHTACASIHVVEDAARAGDYLRDELFGPDLAVEPVADLRAAIGGLAGHAANFVSLFGGDLDAWQQVRDEVDAGAVLWNHSPLAVSARLAFAARGTAPRGARGIAALTRTVVDCRAPTAPAAVAAALPASASALERTA